MEERKDLGEQQGRRYNFLFPVSLYEALMWEKHLFNKRGFPRKFCVTYMWVSTIAAILNNIKIEVTDK